MPVFLASALLPLAVSAQAQVGPAGALQFGGSPPSYVQVASNASLTLGNQVTFEAWVNPSVNASSATIISRGDGGNGSLTDYIVQLESSGSGFVLAFFAAGGWDYSAHTVPSNTWSHVAVTYDGASKIFYINGAPDITNSRPGTLYSSGSPVYIGRQGSACACNYFNGMMDEVRVWSVVRTASQISQNFNQPLTGTEAGLAAYYKFDYITGVTARDSSTNGNTGTLVNRPEPLISGVPFALKNFTLLGSNPLTNDCHTPFLDPGSEFLTAPVRLGADVNTFFVVKGNKTVEGWGLSYFGETNIPPGLTNVIAVAGGCQDSTVLALKGDRTVVAWGNTNVGFGVVPASATNVIAVAAGREFGLALKADGTVAAWGDNTYGQTNVPAGATNVVAISAGFVHAIALKADGTLIAWGDNQYGQTNIPANATNVIAIAAEFLGNIALRGDGSVIYWGDNQYGEANVPPNLTNVIAVAGGSIHGLALKADGSVVAWGYPAATNVPPSATNIIAFTANDNDSLALRADGTLITWGVVYSQVTNIPADIDETGPLVTATATYDVNTPGTYPLSYTVTNAAGTSFTNSRTLVVADLTPPQVTVLGANPMILTNGQAFADPGATAYDLCNGNESIVTSGTVNTNVPGLYHIAYTAVDPVGNSHTALRSVLVLPQPFLATLGANPLTNHCETVYSDPGAALQVSPRGIAAGGYNSFAIKADGTLAAWGDNTYGGTNVPPAATNVVTVGAGYFQDLAVRADGSVVAWGDNSLGQTNVPASATNVVAAASGGYQYDLVLRADGTVLAWGDNSASQTNVPTNATNVVAIASGYAHALALKADGTLVSWGYGFDGETDIPAAATNVVAIAAGYYESYALRADGVLLAWGDNSLGEIKIPAAATNVVALAAGGEGAAYALRADGTVVAWGDNSYGEISIPATVTNVVAIAAGDSAALAMRADGTVIAWGDNSYREANVPLSAYQQPIPFTASGTVNTNVSGTYSITYTATNNGIALTNSRTVIVGDTTAPALSLLGANPLQWIAGTPFVDPGATASNSCAGDLTGSIQVTGTVNTAVPGSYTLTYSVTDPTGNSTTSKRTVLVVSAPSLGGFAESIVSNNPVTATVTAQLSATVNPNGLASTAWFQYGLNTSYSASNALVLPAVYTSSNLTSLVPALSRSVIYHWRAVGSNAVGVTFGPDQTVFAPGLTLAGDLNGNGFVSQSDLNAVLSNYFGTNALYMTNVTGLGHSNVTFQLTNSLEGGFSVQVSTNLIDWQPLDTAIPVFEFTDTNAPAGPTRYYRLSWP